MALIAASLGFVVYPRFGFTGAESALVGLGCLTASPSTTPSPPANATAWNQNQLANLAARFGRPRPQLAEMGRRLSAVEGKVDTVIDRALATAQPLAAEIEELSTLVKQLADSVAAHDAVLQNPAPQNPAFADEHAGERPRPMGRYEAPAATISETPFAAVAAPIAAAPPTLERNSQPSPRSRGTRSLP